MTNNLNEKVEAPLDDLLSTLIKEVSSKNKTIEAVQKLTDLELNKFNEETQDNETNQKKSDQYKVDIFKNVEIHEKKYLSAYNKSRFLERNWKNKLFHIFSVKVSAVEMCLVWLLSVFYYTFTENWLFIGSILIALSVLSFYAKILFRGFKGPEDIVQNWVAFMTYTYKKIKEERAESYTEEDLENFIKLAIYENGGIHSITIDKFYEDNYWEKRKKLISFINMPYYYKY